MLATEGYGAFDTSMANQQPERSARSQIVSLKGIWGSWGSSTRPLHVGILAQLLLSLPTFDFGRSKNTTCTLFFLRTTMSQISLWVNTLRYISTRSSVKQFLEGLALPKSMRSPGQTRCDCTLIYWFERFQDSRSSALSAICFIPWF